MYCVVGDCELPRSMEQRVLLQYSVFCHLQYSLFAERVQWELEFVAQLQRFVCLGLCCAVLLVEAPRFVTILVVSVHTRGAYGSLSDPNAATTL